MKKIAYLAMAIAFAVSANAQPGVGVNGSQPVSLILDDVIEIAPATIGDAMATFSSVSDYDGGKFFTNAAMNTQGDQDIPDQFQWVVKSTKNFNVWVRAENPVNPASTFFHYQGLSSIYNQMALNKLLMKVFQNNTGGSVLNYSGWAGLEKAAPGSPNGKVLIQNGNMGVRNFKTIYKTSPAWHFAAGTYVARIVYTATQL